MVPLVQTRKEDLIKIILKCKALKNISRDDSVSMNIQESFAFLSVSPPNSASLCGICWVTRIAGSSLFSNLC